MLKKIKIYNNRSKNKMKKLTKSNNFYLIIILILSSIINFNKCECLNEEAFEYQGNCVDDCTIDELLDENDGCIPISQKDEDIDHMMEIIAKLFERTDLLPQLDTINIIRGNGIYYSIIQKILIGNSDINLEDSVISGIQDDCLIVLVNIINTNYSTTSKGIRLVCPDNVNQLMSSMCPNEKINIGVEIQISDDEITLYKQIKEEYDYDIFNFNDPFYLKKCTKFTTPYKTDISLPKRKEVYSTYVRDVCSDICTYEKFDENVHKVFCNCVYEGEKRVRTDIELEIINFKIINCMKNIFENYQKNYIFFVMSGLCFIFVICFFATCITLPKKISEFKKEFEKMKLNIEKYYKEEEEKERLKRMKDTDESYKIKLDFKDNKKMQDKINITDIEIFNHNLRDVYIGHNPYFRYYQFQKIKNKNNMDNLQNYYNKKKEEYERNNDYINNLKNYIKIKKKAKKRLFKDFNEITSFSVDSDNNKEKRKKEKKKEVKNKKLGLYEELMKQNNIDIFRKKAQPDYFIKNDEKEKKEEKKEDKNENNQENKGNFNIDKRYSTSKNIFIKRNNKIYKSNELDNFYLNLKNKANKHNPPKNANGSRRYLISSSMRSKNGLSLINNNIENQEENQQQQSPDNNANKKKFDIKLGSEEYFKFLNKLPEKKRIKFFKESEINHLEYRYAYDIDDRMIFQILKALIKEQNNLVFSLSLCGNDYNVPILKFSFFIFQLILYLTVTCLFFGDYTINNLYENRNKFDIKIMWRPMLCIVVVCILINLLLKNLIKFNNTIVDIKYEVQKLNEGINALRLKLVFYFLISFAISGFGWILVCSFCTIYSNSIKPLLIMAGLSLGATFIFQILFCVLVSSLRACSLNRTKKNCKYLYSFSNILTYL